MKYHLQGELGGQTTSIINGVINIVQLQQKFNDYNHGVDVKYSIDYYLASFSYNAIHFT
jgi:hypothetical protein